MSVSSGRASTPKNPIRERCSCSRPERSDRPYKCSRCKRHLPGEGYFVHCSGCNSSYHFECIPLQKHAYCAMSDRNKQNWRCPLCRRKESVSHSREAGIQTARTSEDEESSSISNKVDVLDLRLNIMINDLRSEVAFLKNEALTNQKITYFVNMQCEELKKELCELKAFVCEQLQQQSSKIVRDTVDLLGVGQQVDGSLVIGQNGSIDYECRHRNSAF